MILYWVLKTPQMLNRVMKVLPKRFEKYKLELHAEKTRDHKPEKQTWRRQPEL